VCLFVHIFLKMAYPTSSHLASICVCVYVCMCVYVCVCERVLACNKYGTGETISMWCSWVCMCVCVYVCVRVYMHLSDVCESNHDVPNTMVSIRVCVCECACVPRTPCTYTHARARVHTHTLTRTHPHPHPPTPEATLTMTHIAHTSTNIHTPMHTPTLFKETHPLHLRKIKKAFASMYHTQKSTFIEFMHNHAQNPTHTYIQATTHLPTNPHKPTFSITPTYLLALKFPFENIFQVVRVV